MSTPKLKPNNSPTQHLDMPADPKGMDADEIDMYKQAVHDVLKKCNTEQEARLYEKVQMTINNWINNNNTLKIIDKNRIMIKNNDGLEGIDKERTQYLEHLLLYYCCRDPKDLIAEIDGHKKSYINSDSDSDRYSNVWGGAATTVTWLKLSTASDDEGTLNAPAATATTNESETRESSEYPDKEPDAHIKPLRSSWASLFIWCCCWKKEKPQELNNAPTI